MALAVLITIFPGFSSLCRAAYTNGIYAEFNTSMGSYTCRLEYTIAPKACANFIGLATGQRHWLDETTGLIKTNALYSGIIFHRVASNFVIQSGSPTGLPDGGPGYVFVDEFSPSLRHDSFGILSMGNSGPDSNDSQWFITVLPRPDLNDRYTAFGRLYGGSNVVYAINRVATDANEKPLTNVPLNAITIRRVGASASLFDINAYSLPTVTNLNLKFNRTGTNASLTFSNRLYASTRLYDSLDLAYWTQTILDIENVAGPVTNVTVGFDFPKQFFRAAQVQYPSSTFSPRNLNNRTLTLTFTNGQTGTLVISFNAAGGGTYTYNGSPGNVLGYDWFQRPYTCSLWPLVLDGAFNNDLTLKLNFDSNTVGSFSGFIYPGPYYYPYSPFLYPVAGSLTLSP